MLSLLLALSAAGLVGAIPIPHSSTLHHRAEQTSASPAREDSQRANLPMLERAANALSPLIFVSDGNVLELADVSDNAPSASETVPVLVSPPQSTTDEVTVSAFPFSPASPMMAAYYPDWGADSMSPEEIDFDRFDWIDFAFAVPNAQFGLDFDSDEAKDLLKRLVAAAHSKKKFVKLSIGGWDGSAHFSQAVGDETSRAKFVKNIISTYNDYNIDGIDLDWEYPGQEGQSGNSVSPQDTKHFLTFLQILRAGLPANARVTAACQVSPFADENSKSISDASEFASVLDWIMIMNYDTWGSSSSPGSNAPLDDGCRNSSQSLSNAVSAVTSWTRAGFPASQIVLGVPSYGYISHSIASRLQDKRQIAEQDLFALSISTRPNTPNEKTQAGVSSPLRLKNDDGGTDDGQVQFRDLVGQGALKVQNGSYVGAHGFKRIWDECSSTVRGFGFNKSVPNHRGQPFLRSEYSQQVITYDDPESLQLKAAYAREAGLLGINMFDVHGDTKNWVLTDATRTGLGLL